jgi:hypothetical protein
MTTAPPMMDASPRSDLGYGYYGQLEKFVIIVIVFIIVNAKVEAREVVVDG